MKFKRINPKIISFIGLLFVRLLAFTMKFDKKQIEFGRNYSKNGNNVIYAFWHAEMLMVGYSYRNLKIQALVSQHRDGGYLDEPLKSLGYQTIRGSSTRGGARAMVKLTKIVRKGHSVLITPDGPRGPRHIVQPGVIFLAKKAGIPILPVKTTISRYWRLSSWDKFIIPKPFAKFQFNYGELIHIPPDLNNQDLQKYCVILENALDSESD